MNADRASLIALLTAKKDFGSVEPRVLAELLEPFCRKADAGFYDLAERDRLDVRALRRIIGSATSRTVDAIEFVSFREHTRGVEGETAFWTNLVKRVGLGLNCALAPRCGKRKHGCQTYEQFEDAFWAAVGEPLWHSFEANSWEITGHNFRLMVRANILQSIACCLCGAARGCRSELVPLVRSLAETITLGEVAGRPRVWIAVCA